MRIIVSLAFFLAFGACDRIRFFTAENTARENFQTHQAAFIAFGNALDAHPNVSGATNCDTDEQLCWRIGRNFAVSAAEDFVVDNETFIPHLNSIGLDGYVFFQRGNDGRVWLPDYNAGRTGDYELTWSYTYWPDSEKILDNCANYIPPTEDFYNCSIDLGGGWMIVKSGWNSVKFETCFKTIYDCVEAGGTYASCKPEECRELIKDW